MLEREVLIRESRAVVDGSRAGAVAVQEVAALDHEAGDHAVEFAAFVALCFAQCGLVLAGAELAKVLRGLWGGPGEELHFYAAEWFAWVGSVSFLGDRWVYGVDLCGKSG